MRCAALCCVLCQQGAGSTYTCTQGASFINASSATSRQVCHDAASQASICTATYVLGCSCILQLRPDATHNHATACAMFAATVYVGMRRTHCMQDKPMYIQPVRTTHSTMTMHTRVQHYKLHESLRNPGPRCLTTGMPCSRASAESGRQHQEARALLCWPHLHTH